MAMQVHSQRGRTGSGRLAAAAAAVLAGCALIIGGPGSVAALAGAQGGSQQRAVARPAGGRAGSAPVSRARPRRSAPLLSGAPRKPAAVSYASTYTVDTTADSPWAAAACASGNSGTCSLRAAVTQANTDNTLDEIVVPAGTYLLETNELVVTDTAGVDIAGAGASATAVEADSTSPDYPFRVFQVNGGALADISGLTVEDGYSSASTAIANTEDGYGGGIEVLNGTLDLTNSTVTGSRSDANGGGIYVAGQDSVPSSPGPQSQAYLEDVTISGNTASGNGGGLDDEGQVQAGHLAVTGNTADGQNGGGITMDYNGSYGPSLEGTAVTVTGNSSSYEGGGIFNDGTLDLSGSTVGTTSVPNASGDGGGLYNNFVAKLVSTAVQGNTASDAGAGLFNDYQLTVYRGSVRGNGPASSSDSIGGGGVFGRYDTVLTQVAVSGNSAAYGGGIYEECCTLTVSGGSISANSATDQGGGLYDSYPVHLNGTTLAGNTAGQGGAIYDNGVLHLNRVRVGTASAPNTAAEGGGIYAYDTSETISHSTIAHNQASDGGTGVGGGIFNIGEIDMIDSTVTANSADDAGGGIFNAQYDIDITGSTISANTAASAGGGIENEAGLTTTNDTVALNQAGSVSTPGEGAGIYNDTTANATLTNLTLSGNTALDGGDGGGVYNAGTFHLKGTILAGDTGAAGQTNCGGTAAVSSAGYNLEDDSSCALSGPGDLNNANPGLGPLRFNGGPTKTEAIPTTSPAAGADSSCPPPATDQRGVKRSSPCDIGAYENAAK